MRVGRVGGCWGRSNEGGRPGDPAGRGQFDSWVGLEMTGAFLGSERKGKRDLEAGGVAPAAGDAPKGVGGEVDEVGGEAT